MFVTTTKTTNNTNNTSTADTNNTTNTTNTNEYWYRARAVAAQREARHNQNQRSK